MQSTRLHLERVSLAAIDEAIETLRKSARHGVRSWKHGAQPDELRALVEFLLRPARAQIEALKASGLSLAEKSPAQEARERAEPTE